LTQWPQVMPETRTVVAFIGCSLLRVGGPRA
jgi:hypothetical protein